MVKKDWGGTERRIFFPLFPSISVSPSYQLKNISNGLFVPLLFTNLSVPSAFLSVSWLHGQMPVACRMPPTSRACRRSRSAHWRST